MIKKNLLIKSVLVLTATSFVAGCNNDNAIAPPKASEATTPSSPPAEKEAEVKKEEAQVKTQAPAPKANIEKQVKELENKIAANRNILKEIAKKAAVLRKSLETTEIPSEALYAEQELAKLEKASVEAKKNITVATAKRNQMQSQDKLVSLNNSKEKLEKDLGALDKKIVGLKKQIESTKSGAENVSPEMIDGLKKLEDSLKIASNNYSAIENEIKNINKRIVFQTAFQNLAKDRLTLQKAMETSGPSDKQTDKQKENLEKLSRLEEVSSLNFQKIKFDKILGDYNLALKNLNEMPGSIKNSQTAKKQEALKTAIADLNRKRSLLMQKLNGDISKKIQANTKTSEDEEKLNSMEKKLRLSRSELINKIAQNEAEIEAATKKYNNALKQQDPASLNAMKSEVSTIKTKIAENKIPNLGLKASNSKVRQLEKMIDAEDKKIQAALKDSLDARDIIGDLDEEIPELKYAIKLKEMALGIVALKRNLADPSTNPNQKIAIQKEISMKIADLEDGEMPFSVLVKSGVDEMLKKKGTPQ